MQEQFSFYDTKSDEVFKKALTDLKQEYELKDQEIFQSEWRKKQGYIPHGIRERTITTIFGVLKYKRHRYRYWDNSKYKFVYLSDLALGIEKYQRITNHVQVKILSLIAEGKRYRDILDCLPNVKFKCRTISNIISRSKISSLNKVVKNVNKKLKVDHCLYINLDDTFLNLKVENKKQRFRIRVILFHTGYNNEKSSSRKNVLKNVRIFTLLLKQDSKIETQKFMEKVYKLANYFYQDIAQKKVIINGDGAYWIRQCAKYWPRSIYILDKFHAFKNAAQVFNPKNEELRKVYEKIKLLFSSGNYEELMNLLNKQHFEDWPKTVKLEQLKNYFSINEKFANGITNQKQPENIGCNVESVISHNIKWLLGFGSKAFSEKVYRKMLTIHISKINGIPVIDLLKNEIVLKTQKRNEFFQKCYWNKKPLKNNFVSNLLTRQKLLTLNKV